MKKIISSLLLLIASLGVFAQDAATTETASGFWKDPFADPMFPFYAVMVFVFLVSILVLLVAAYMLRILNMFVRQAAEEKAAKLGIRYVPQPSWWQKLNQKLTGSVPMEKEATIMLDHNYDGIKELDNHLPPWWKWLFYGTIAWSVVYLVIYHVTDSQPLMEEEYAMEVAKAEEKLQQFKASQPTTTIDETTLAYSNDGEILNKGKKIFEGQCASCHRADGGGGIGPNLTDAYWIHGGNVSNIYATIKNGVPEKGMISWTPILNPEQIRDVSFYIVSIKGTNPVNPKAPQGDLFQEAQPVQTDSIVAKSSAGL